ncbi:uncharacterized protein LOC133320782 [Danaus plexippus]|uniref:uncharacterized protein LOC133320782 n=1 Tax=Danaus plexippus TaxID=13037 RepID=UPI002AB078CC|nr:uncharacterized protein LOC133320782 [Danaus plexippus]
MKKLHVFLLFFYFGFSLSMWLPITKFSRSRATKPPLFPPPSELKEEHLYKLKIPNKKLCDEMERNQHGKYLLIPWLSLNCQVLKDDVARNLSPGDVLPIHRAVINKLFSFRRSGLLKYYSRTTLPHISRI